jgi:hypothetical protein
MGQQASKEQDRLQKRTQELRGMFSQTEQLLSSLRAPTASSEACAAAAGVPAAPGSEAQHQAAWEYYTQLVDERSAIIKCMGEWCRMPSHVFSTVGAGGWLALLPGRHLPSTCLRQL